MNHRQHTASGISATIIERTVTLAVLGELGALLGLFLGGHSFASSVLWGLTGGIASVSVSLPLLTGVALTNERSSRG
ncbi:hypothetical protein [Streptomyces sp. AN091965]|uniref:hypothetical protein n=1 Tax=Streptomyces sp. AN091965 TaxID=2927803 RepID=UPI001F61057E|nr:hypothetical protein [Streptomyces sp. AN091965]MCI3934709.1 hypothetical protein [Streptomyces sp. AN091965]